MDRFEIVKRAADMLDREAEANSTPTAKGRVTHSGGKTREVILTQASSVIPRSIRWLWHGWLAEGTLTILAGAAGAGKTSVALSFAATVSSGGAWPDGQNAEAGAVIIWSGEDGIEDVLVPRLLAAGANMDRCYFANEVVQRGEIFPFDPARDKYLLEEAARRIGGVKLLIVDPVVSVVGGDMHRANDVRRDLQWLVDFARTYSCTVLGITHFGKGSGDRMPQERVIGSQAFSALARMVLVCAKEEGSDRHVLARAKSNVAEDRNGFEYSIRQHAVSELISANRIVWGDMLVGSSREILGRMEMAGRATESKLLQAQTALEKLVGAGIQRAKEVEELMIRAGFSKITIRRAREALGLEVVKIGKNDGWEWRLPQRLQDAHPS